MSNQRWLFLEQALEDLSKSAQSTGLDTILVDRIEAAAAASDKSRLDEASQFLVEFLDKIAELLPEDVQRVIRDGEGDRSILLAHTLGQVGLAQVFSSRLADRRASVEAESALSNPRFVPFLKELYLKDLNGRDLARKVGQSEENVSRVLGELRRLGLASCRKQGTSVMNFLMASARAALTDVGDRERIMRNEARLPAAARLEQVLETLPEHMQTRPDLAPRDILLPS